MAIERQDLAAVLAALDKPALLRLAEMHGLGRAETRIGKRGLQAALLDHPEASFEGVILGLLRRAELERVCEVFGVPKYGDRKAYLVDRILGALAQARAAADGQCQLVPDPWRPFAEARTFARSLGLINQAEWTAYAKGDLREVVGLKPDDIPSTVAHCYRDAGWRGWRDWVGADIRRVDPRWRPFRKARVFVWSLGLADRAGWDAYVRGELDVLPRPSDLPAAPDEVYAGAGWRSWDNWVGNARDPQAGRSRWRAFPDARRFVHGLGLQSAQDWKRYCKGKMPELPPRPDDIPAVPWITYVARGWKSLPDWLRADDSPPIQMRTFRPFREARAFARSLGLKSLNDWKRYCRGGAPGLPERPIDVPVSPASVYPPEEWAGWGDWLGTGRVALAKRRFRTFEAARDFARSLGVSSRAAWKDYRAGRLPDLPPCPPDIPRAPQGFYRTSGWRGWGDFLGSANPSSRRRQWRSFAAARRFARSLRLERTDAWAAYCRGERPEREPLPHDIPRSPQGVYRNRGWRGMCDFLGLPGGFPDQPAPGFCSFEQARELARALGLGAMKEWLAPDGPASDGWRRAHRVPRRPDQLYSGRGWQGWPDFLGTGRYTGHPRAFPAARRFARALKLRSATEWRAYCAGELPDRGTPPVDVPKAPDVVYRGSGWTSWGDFLGTQAVSPQKRTFRPFEEARAFVRTLGLKSHADWRAFCRDEMAGGRPPDIPATPNVAYRFHGWAGMADFLGYGPPRPQR